MADGHQHRADQDRAALAEHAVGKQPAEDGREIDQGRIKAVDLRGEGLGVERAEHRLHAALERGKPHDVLRMPRQQQIFHEVEDEQRAHPVIGKALPHLGGEQKAQAPRMTEKLFPRGGSGLDFAFHRALPLRDRVSGARLRRGMHRGPKRQRHETACLGVVGLDRARLDAIDPAVKPEPAGSQSRRDHGVRLQVAESGTARSHAPARRGARSRPHPPATSPRRSPSPPPHA